MTVFDARERERESRGWHGGHIGSSGVRSLILYSYLILYSSSSEIVGVLHSSAARGLKPLRCKKHDEQSSREPRLPGVQGRGLGSESCPEEAAAAGGLRWPHTPCIRVVLLRPFIRVVRPQTAGPRSPHAPRATRKARLRRRRGYAARCTRRAARMGQTLWGLLER